MAYSTEIQTIEAAGIPTTEYQTKPEIGEQRLITIEFTPNATNNEYLVEQPEFVFGDIIVIKEQWEQLFLNKLDTEDLGTYTICGMELIEPKNKSGQMIDYPFWKYGIRSTDGSKEVMWREEHELVRKASTVADWF